MAAISLALSAAPTPGLGARRPLVTTPPGAPLPFPGTVLAPGVVHHAGDNTLVFFPCGLYMEFYGPQRVVAAATLGLRPIRLRRASYAFTVGFPVWLSGVYLSSAIRQGLRVIEVQTRQTFLRHGCPPRLPRAVWLPGRCCRAADLLSSPDV